MSQKNTSTKKSVNRARKANGSGNKSRSSSVQMNSSRLRGQKQERQVGVSAAYATQQIGRGPIVEATSKKCVVRNRELLASIQGSSNFVVQRRFALNPGIPASFPWLSTMAKSWEKYVFRRLKFEYYTRTGTQTAGSVLLSPDYDAADVAPATEQVASSYNGTVEDAPWKDMKIDLPMSRMHEKGEPKFVRTGPLAANLDIKTYDAGNMHVCTTDGAVVSWGKIWVDYEVEFTIPSLPPNGGLGLGGSIVANGSGVVPANPMGSAPIVDANAEDISIDDLSNVTFATAGTYLAVLSLAGSVITDFTLTPVLHLPVINVFGSFIVNGAGTVARKVWQVEILEPGTVIGLSATATTITGGSFAVALAPADSLV
jgi:hypothetical protein